MAKKDDKQALLDLGLSEEQAQAVIDGPLSGLVKKRDELLASTVTMKEQLSGLQAIGDTNDVKALKSKLSELGAAVDRERAKAEGNYQAALDADSKEFERKVKELEARASAAEQKVTTMVTNSAMQEAMAAAKVHPDFADAITALHAPKVTIADNDVPQIEGKPVTEYLTEWVESDAGKRYKAAPVNTGTGSKGPGDSSRSPASGLKRSEMELDEKVRFISENGREAFENLPA